MEQKFSLIFILLIGVILDFWRGGVYHRSNGSVNWRITDSFWGTGVIKSTTEAYYLTTYFTNVNGQPRGFVDPKSSTAMGRGLVLRCVVLCNGWTFHYL